MVNVLNYNIFMKRFFKLFIGGTFLFFLTGCPASHFYEYKPLKEGFYNNGFYLNKIDDYLTLKIRIGYLRTFINKDEHKLIASILLENKIIYDSIKINIVSNSLGNINENYINDSSLIFHKRMPFNNEDKNINFIKKDTININVYYKSTISNIKLVYK